MLNDLPPDWNSNDLRKFNLNPRTIIDVGAASGTNELYKAFPNSYFVLIEPLKEYEPDLQEVLKKYHGQYFLMGIGDQTGKIIVNIENNNLERTSINKRSQLTASNGEITSREIDITTLDDLQQQCHFQPPLV